MSARPLFYVSNCADLVDARDDEFELGGPEAQHITGAKRLRVGDELDITNGTGLRLTTVIAQIGLRQKSLSLRVIAKTYVEQPPKQIILASAIAKGDRQTALIEMACQLGVTHLWPVQYDFSIVKYSDKTAQRWQRIVIEACKQSRRVWFPEIKPLIAFDELLAKNSSDLRLLGHQMAPAMSAYQAELKTADTIILLVGPEGGLSDRELRIVDEENIKCVSLGEHILRIETACSAIIAAVNSNTQ